MAKKNKKNKKDNILQDTFHWVNSLPGEKADMIRTYAEWQSRKDMKTTIDSFERALSASVINVVEVDWDAIEDIKTNFINFMEDDVRTMGKNKDLYGGIEMAIKKVNECEKEIVVKANELIDLGFKQKEMVDKLVMDFPMLSKAMIVNAVKRIRAERLKTSEDAANYILEGKKKIEEKVKKDNKKTGIEKLTNKEREEFIQDVVKNVREEIENCEPDHIAEIGKMVKDKAQEDKEEKEVIIDGLEILEEVVVKEVKLKGINGLYHAKTGVGVTLEREGYNLTFNTTEELEGFCNEFKRVFERI